MGSSTAWSGAAAPAHVDNGQVTNQATLVIIMFLMGITRAWEIVGATRPRMFDVLAHEPHARPADDTAPR